MDDNYFRAEFPGLSYHHSYILRSYIGQLDTGKDIKAVCFRQRSGSSDMGFDDMLKV